MSSSMQKYRVPRRTAPRPGTASAIACAAAASLVGLPAGPARADCTSAAPSVVWSSPAAGAVDVPVDADLLLLTESIDLTSAELSIFVGGLRELPIEAGSAFPGHYDLPELEPNQAHTIVVRHAGGTPITLRFTTGERRAAVSDAALKLTSISEDHYARGAVEAGLCSDVLFRNTCFDTGAPPLRSFEVDAGVAALDPDSLWSIEMYLPDLPESPYLDYGPGPYFASWPAACGSPRQWASDIDAEYRLYNIGENGVVRQSNTLAHAFEPPPPPQQDYDRPSHIICNVSPGLARAPATLAAACALAAAALWRRRRTRAR